MNFCFFRYYWAQLVKSLASVGVTVLLGLEPATLRKKKQACRWFFTSAVFCAKTWVLPMELGGIWCYPGLWMVPDGTSQASLPHVNPPNLGSQMLRLQHSYKTVFPYFAINHSETRHRLLFWQFFLTLTKKNPKTLHLSLLARIPKPQSQFQMSA